MSLIGFVIDRLFPPPPTAFEHPEIGRLEQDSHWPGGYGGAAEWDSGTITLFLHGDRPTKGGLENAAQYFLAMRARAAQVRDAAAECAAEHMYEKWCDERFENDKPRDQRKADLAIERIWIDPLGNVGIDFRFDKPFWGHHLTVSGVAPDRSRFANLSV